MKKKYVNIILIGLAVLNIIDGAFNAMSPVGIINIVLLAVCLILSLMTERKSK